jgi:PPOX class probable F420-dependent enzyme
MGPGERLAGAMNRLYDRMRDPAAFRVRAEDAITGSLDPLRGHKYGLVISFRRNGEAVPSPVWMAVDAGGRMYFETASNTGKVKRIRRDSRVLVAPSNVRGKPLGPVVAGTARVLPREEWEHAETTLAGAFGVGRKLYEGVFRMPEDLRTYVEVAPSSSP